MRISGIDFFIFYLFESYDFPSCILLFPSCFFPGTRLLFSSSEESGFKRFHSSFFSQAISSLFALFFHLFLIQTLCFLTPLHSFHPLCSLLPPGDPEAVPCSTFNWMNRSDIKTLNALIRVTMVIDSIFLFRKKFQYNITLFCGQGT